MSYISSLINSEKPNAKPNLRSRSQAGFVVLLNYGDHILNVAGNSPHAVRHPTLDRVHSERDNLRGQRQSIGQPNRVIIEIGEIL